MVRLSEVAMQRNMDLVRKILLRLDNSTVGLAPRDFNLPTHSQRELIYHAHIMSQDGLIEADAPAPIVGPDSLPRNMTWSGHEFLDLARDQDRWNKAKAIIGKVGGAPIAVWTKVLTELMLQGVEVVPAKAG